MPNNCIGFFEIYCCENVPSNIGYLLSLFSYNNVLLSYTDLNIAEKEGPKLTTYANEWSTPRDDQTRIPFEPKRKPVLNTNFQGEWTANIENVRPTQDGQIRPSRPSFGNRNTDYERIPYDPRENNNWNSLGSRRPPQSNIGDATSEDNLGKKFKFLTVISVPVVLN